MGFTRRSLMKRMAVSAEELPAEGLVARPKQPLFDRMGKLIVTKLKHKDFTWE